MSVERTLPSEVRSKVGIQMNSNLREQSRVQESIVGGVGENGSEKVKELHLKEEEEQEEGRRLERNRSRVSGSYRY